MHTSGEGAPCPNGWSKFRLAIAGCAVGLAEHGARRFAIELPGKWRQHGGTVVALCIFLVVAMWAWIGLRVPRHGPWTHVAFVASCVLSLACCIQLAWCLDGGALVVVREAGTGGVLCALRRRGRWFPFATRRVVYDDANRCLGEVCGPFRLWGCSDPGGRPVLRATSTLGLAHYLKRRLGIEPPSSGGAEIQAVTDGRAVGSMAWCETAGSAGQVAHSIAGVDWRLVLAMAILIDEARRERF